MEELVQGNPIHLKQRECEIHYSIKDLLRVLCIANPCKCSHASWLGGSWLLTNQPQLLKKLNSEGGLLLSSELLQSLPLTSQEATGHARGKIFPKDQK